MAKLHELLAVEGDLEGNAQKIIEEAVITFGKRIEHFAKSERSYQPIADGEPEQPTEYHDLTTTVPEKIEYVFSVIEKYWDATYQKEATNQSAKADLIVDGVVLIKDAPATALLSYENKLKKLRPVLEQAPTLAPGIEWEIDTNLSGDVRKIYRAVHPEEKNRTVKSFNHKVLVPATDKHPAQVEKWEEQVVVGKYVKNIWSGAITVADKSKYLGKLDNLLREIKKARQRANEAEVVKVNVAKTLLDFILK